MADNTTLQYLKSIDERTARIEENMRDGFKDFDQRIDSLEETRDKQKGIMIGGGAVVSCVSAFVAWVVAHLGSHS